MSIFTRRAVLLLAACAGMPGASLRAQRVLEPFVVEPFPLSPSGDRVMLRGDTAFFFQIATKDSNAWIFDRARQTFARVAHAELPFYHGPPYDITSATTYRDTYALVDSLALARFDPSNAFPTNVLRSRSGTIALRGPRIAAERRWRVEHGLSAMPSTPDPEEPHPPPAATTWGPVAVVTFAADQRALWLGLGYDPAMFGTFALGGLLRVDRRTHAVRVITDSLLFHTSVRAMVPWREGYVTFIQRDVNTDSAGLVFFDPATSHARAIPLSPYLSPLDLVLSSDTAWVAAGNSIALIDLSTNRVTQRRFQLALHSDSIVYELAEHPVLPSLPFAAGIALASDLALPNVAEFIRAANGVLRVDAFQVRDEDERFPETVDRDTTGAADSTMPARGYDGSLVGFVLGGLDARALRPFLYEALRIARLQRLDDVAAILTAAHDTAATPTLRAALDSMDRRDTLVTYPYNGLAAAPIATALALLGDSTGVRWVHTVLGIAPPNEIRPELAGRKPSTLLVNAGYSAAIQYHDSTVMRLIIAALADTAEQYTQTARLLAYDTREAWRAAATALSTHTVANAAGLLFDRVAHDASGLADDPVVRDSARSLARRVFESAAPGQKDAAGVLLARYGDETDLPSIIGAVDHDSLSYEPAVLTLVQITGEGVDAMPRGKATPAERAAAARWWRDWYDAHRQSFHAAPKRVGDIAWQRMVARIHQR